MGRRNLVKICTIIGFILAEVYMVFAVLAPNVPGKALASRMLFSPDSIPRTADEPPPGTAPPVAAKVTRLLVGGFFFGPFGACIGLGVGLLLQGGLGKMATWRGASRQKP